MKAEEAIKHQFRQLKEMRKDNGKLIEDKTGTNAAYFRGCFTTLQILATMLGLNSLAAEISEENTIDMKAPKG